MQGVIIMKKSKTICIAAKATACFLAVCMLIGLCGVTAYAEEIGITVPDDNPGVNPLETGDITVTVNNDNAVGIEVNDTSGVGETQVVSTGDITLTVTADDGFWYEGDGIWLHEGANASNTIDVGAIDVSVTVEDECATAFGIRTETGAGGHQTTINTDGITVTVDGDDYSNAVGIDLYSSNSKSGDNSSLEISVDGDIAVHNELSTAQGVRLYNDEGKNNSMNITVDGNVTATMNTDDDELAEGMALTTEGTGNRTTVVVDGDMTADTRGMAIITDDGGTTDVVVTGTISGKKNGVGFDGDVNAENTSLTTWKIDSNGVLVDDLFGSMSSDAISTIAKEVIHYIVKLKQPTQGDILNAVKNDGKPLETKTYTDIKGVQTTVETENESNIIRLTLSDDKYEIESAENLDNGDQLSKDDKGFYYVVPRGGGILLSATLKEKSDPGPGPGPGPEPQPCWSGSGIKIIYELDGGFYKDDPGPIIRYCSPGQIIRLLDAPEKEGFEFGGWYREVGNRIETYSARDRFQPWTTVTFTAIWNEA